VTLTSIPTNFWLALISIFSAGPEAFKAAALMLAAWKTYLPSAVNAPISVIHFSF
jgi:hypothetical protein